MQPSFRKRRRIAGTPRSRPQVIYEKLSDPILVRRAKDGDQRALEALCERHAPRVERLCRHLLGNTADAQDAAQDALARLCVKIDQFRGESALTTWLHRLTVNACRDIVQRRAAGRWEELDEDLRTCTEVGPVREAELTELRSELRAGLAGLPADQARVLVLKDALGFSFQEISDASGMPVGTAKCYAHRGRAGMRELLAVGAALSPASSSAAAWGEGEASLAPTTGGLL